MYLDTKPVNIYKRAILETGKKVNSFINSIPSTDNGMFEIQFDTNMKTYKFSVIGGDFRTIAASNKLKRLGNDVKVFGFDDTSAFDKKIVYTDNLSDALFDSDYVNRTSFF